MGYSKDRVHRKEVLNAKGDKEVIGINDNMDKLRTGPN